MFLLTGIAALLGVIGGLASFLREVYLATHSTNIDPAYFRRRSRA